MAPTSSNSILTAPATTRDDGIRVHSNSMTLDTENYVPTTSMATSSTLFSEDDTQGIRVFPFIQEGETTRLPNTFDREESNDSSSSSWSLLQPEGMTISSSSESLTHSLGLENPPNNIPPDNEEDILQEVNTSTEGSNSHEIQEVVEQQNETYQLNHSSTESKPVSY